MSAARGVPQFVIPGWLLSHVAEVRTWPAISTPEPVCLVTACGRTVHSLGFCAQHYGRFRASARRGGLTVTEWSQAHRFEVAHASAVQTPETVCWVASCDRSALTHGLCKAHLRLARYHFRHERDEEQRLAPASDRETPTKTPEEANHE